MDETVSPPKLTLRAVQRFTKAEVSEHLKRHHPNCPSWIRKHVVQNVANGPWIDTSLGKAVGLAMQAVVRHDLTAYDKVLLTANPAKYDTIKRNFTKKAIKIIRSWN